MSLEKRKIFFRADASAEIGYGHFIRTLALADMLKEDFDCTFFTQTPTAYQKDEVAKVCKLVELPATDEKFSLFLEYLSGDEIVVLDNYFFTTDYQLVIKLKGCSLVCIDDLHDKHYVADVVINHGVVDSRLFSIESYTRLCIGFNWLLLRSPFLRMIEESKCNIRPYKVAFAFGGVDILGLSYKVANLLDNMRINAIGIVGDIIADKLKNKYEYVRFVSRISAKEVADIFYNSEYAILPASTMSLEAISCGAKLIMGYFVDNQMEFSNYMANNGYSYNLADMSQSCFENNLRCILTKVQTSKSLLNNIRFPNGTKDRFLTLFNSL